MRLNKTWFVSFPRSGHHMTIQMLRSYFGDDLRYVARYETDLQNHPETNLVKSHDFELVDVPTDEWKYIVLLRDPLEAIQSWYDLEVGDEKKSCEQDAFFKEKLEFWKGFVEKWVIGQQKRALIFHYRQMTTRPIPTLARVIRHISEGPLDVERLIQATKHVVDTGFRPNSYFGDPKWSGNKIVIRNDDLIERFSSMSGDKVDST